MRRRLTDGLAWSLWALTAVVCCVGLVLGARSAATPPYIGGGPQVTAILRVLYALTFLLAATLGARIASRRPANPIGWILCAGGLLEGFRVSAGLIAGAVPSAATAVFWLAACLGAADTALIGPLLLLFPSGRLPSRHWRGALWLTLAAPGLAALAVAFRPGVLPGTSEYENPLGIAGAAGALAALYGLATLVTPVGLLLAAGSLVVRFRGARGDERQQLKWIASGAVVWMVALAATFVLPTDQYPPMSVVVVVALDLFVASVGLAVLKYRLYDIDFIIGRTLVYGALAAAITAVYVAVVAGIGGFVGTGGESNPWLALAATALAALAFQPLRERLQRLANRLVYGQRATPYEVLAGFSRRLAGAHTLDAVLPGVAEAAARGVGATRSRVRVYVPNGAHRAATWPAGRAEAAEREDGFDRAIPVLHQGQTLGEIAVAKAPGEPVTPADERLLADLADLAGPALQNVRLGLALQARLEELQASRQRIVAAQDTERRRLERDLHDGAQQQLVALAVGVRVALELVRTDPAETEALLAEVGQQAGEALESLRDLARGIFPPVLADRGIAAALEAQLAKTGQAVRLEVDATAASARFDPDVEAAVYFCCLEALQNAAKHAPGAPAALRLATEPDGWLAFALRDEGPGFLVADVPGGAGLQNMADRLAALSGSLEVRAAPGRGTTVMGRVPVLPAVVPRPSVLPPDQALGRTPLRAAPGESQASPDERAAAVAAAQAARRAAGPKSAFGR